MIEHFIEVPNLRRTFVYKLDVKEADIRNEKIDGVWHSGWIVERQRTDTYLYNLMLQQRKDAYKADPSKTLTRFDQQTWLSANRMAHPYWRNINLESLRTVGAKLERAYNDFYRRVKAGADKPGFPKFASVQNWRTITYGTGGWRVEGSWLVINKCNDAPERRIHIRLHRPLEGTPKLMSITRKADGYHVAFSVVLDQKPAPLRIGPSIGIDLGITHFIATSDGTMHDGPKALNENLARLRRVQRSLSRKVKGSQNRRDQKAIVGKTHLDVANLRKDAHHKLALQLVTEFAMIAHEKLNIKGLVKGMLSRQVADMGWSQFLAILKEKADEHGTRLVAVDPRNTSQMCSGCGAMPEVSKTLRVRVHRCAACGLVMDRDVNAARNILARAQASA